MQLFYNKLNNNAYIKFIIKYIKFCYLFSIDFFYLNDNNILTSDSKKLIIYIINSACNYIFLMY